MANSRKNKIAIALIWIGVLNIVVGFILGIMLGRENVGTYTDRYEQIWPLTFIYWISGFVSGMFFVGLSEIIEQLHKINLKLGKESENDELELLND
ncbi:hypothetical protein PAECIP111893_01496 [Paenibacillus plantiphilus]|uniref:DUF3955 domain-containing protein n=1 Tax=Paenibacillus plantiphilus TaxID=2905650 RepID=A0ABM9C2Y8_9BACL|nr:hypothetical protein [Paenibacillus plantiphilus]CAH1200608.1 hypothetical protein PAECIP111893_01496 [Paenibacillus plantiphilus]